MPPDEQRRPRAEGAVNGPTSERDQGQSIRFPRRDTERVEFLERLHRAGVSDALAMVSDRLLLEDDHASGEDTLNAGELILAEYADWLHERVEAVIADAEALSQWAAGPVMGGAS